MERSGIRVACGQTPESALAFVREHGVVLASAKGPVPRMTEAIVGATIKGSWWAHPEGKRIFAALQSLEHSPDVLVCRLVDGKLSLVHRRLWPALVRLARRFPPDRLARVKQMHTAAGHHENQEVAFPHWVPADVMRQSKKLTEEEAEESLGAWIRKTTGKTNT